MAHLDNIDWPALRIGSPSCAALRYENPDALAELPFGSVAVINGMATYGFIDSTGNLFEVIRVDVADSVSRLRRIANRLLNLRTPVRFDLVQREAGIDTLKALLSQNILENEDLFAERDDIDELLARVGRCNTPEELVKLF